MFILRPVKLSEFWLAATLPNRSSSSAYPTRVWSSSFGSIWLRLAEPKFTKLDRRSIAFSKSGLQKIKQALLNKIRLNTLHVKSNFYQTVSSLTSGLIDIIRRLEVK